MSPPKGKGRAIFNPNPTRASRRHSSGGLSIRPQSASNAPQEPATSSSSSGGKRTAGPHATGRATKDGGGSSSSAKAARTNITDRSASGGSGGGGGGSRRTWRDGGASSSNPRRPSTPRPAPRQHQPSQGATFQPPATLAPPVSNRTPASAPSALSNNVGGGAGPDMGRLLGLMNTIIMNQTTSSPVAPEMMQTLSLFQNVMNAHNQSGNTSPEMMGQLLSLMTTMVQNQSAPQASSQVVATGLSSFGALNSTVSNTGHGPHPTEPPGQARERGVRNAASLAATPFFIDVHSVKVDGALPSKEPAVTFDSCPVFAAQDKFIRFGYPIPDADRQKKIKDGPSARRTDFRHSVKEACREVLDELLARCRDPREGHEFAPWETPHQLFNDIVGAASFLDNDDTVMVHFLNRFFAVSWDRGHKCILPNDLCPTFEDVYGPHAGQSAYQQIFVPLVTFSAMVAAFEPIPDDVPGIDSVYAAADWKINEVFKKGGTSTFKPLEKAWSTLMWECYKDFTFSPGRPAAFLLNKSPSEVTEEDAVKAYCPYLLDKDRLRELEKEAERARDEDEDNQDEGEDDQDDDKDDQDEDEDDQDEDEDDQDEDEDDQDDNAQRGGGTMEQRRPAGVVTAGESATAGGGNVGDHAVVVFDARCQAGPWGQATRKNLWQCTRDYVTPK